MYTLIQLVYARDPASPTRYHLKNKTPRGIPVAIAPKPVDPSVLLPPGLLIQITALMLQQYRGWSIYSVRPCGGWNESYDFAKVWLCKKERLKGVAPRVASLTAPLREYGNDRQVKIVNDEVKKTEEREEPKKEFVLAIRLANKGVAR
ncbi:hypothetical protein HYFRA_00010716 [Hymenoscyphus fraxineus]|uniref:Uncharacterized protein n=1 Tax=Hymenoscyphus fraxineus TaxID=746836 RepID=A0A9N9PW14_9HELO|nr:hypothetical protein HYFRA_00010716 [Hymenoscyphus fraxineus]